MTDKIKYKIQKYTYKLKHAKSRKEADVYQDKLQYYHGLNRQKLLSGGSIPDPNK